MRVGQGLLPRVPLLLKTAIDGAASEARKPKKERLTELRLDYNYLVNK